MSRGTPTGSANQRVTDDREKSRSGSLNSGCGIRQFWIYLHCLADPFKDRSRDLEIVLERNRLRDRDRGQGLRHLRGDIWKSAYHPRATGTIARCSFITIDGLFKVDT